MGNSGATAFVVAFAFSGNEYAFGLFREPGRKPFRVVLSFIFSLEKTDDIDMAHISSICNGVTLLELCTVSQVLHQPVKHGYAL